MDKTRFDAISRLFAERRLSRRQAMQQGAAGLAAAGLATAGFKVTAAQDATPAATPQGGGTGEKISFLFVQSFGAGSIADAGNGNLTLTADHLTRQTVYFSDRPERIVGTVDTAKFLGLDRAPSASATPEGGLGFTPADPPNAALVFNSAAGSDEPGDVLVVELMNPTYDPTSGQATYELKVLADDMAVGMTLVSEPVAVTDAIRSFDGASLFIDDCPDFTYSCYGYDSANGKNDRYLGDIHYGYCYDWGKACCNPCAPIPDKAWLECERVFGYDACHGGEFDSCDVTGQTPAFACM